MYSTIPLSKITVSSIAHLINPTMAFVHPKSSLEATAEVIYRTTVPCPQVYVITPDRELKGCLSIGTAAYNIFRFVLNEARAEELLPAASFLLNAKTAGDLMEPVPAVVRLDDTLEYLINLFREHRLLEAAVVDERGRLCGVLKCRAVLNYYFEHKSEMLASASEE
jgi:predicted transcriptional regulator